MTALHEIRRILLPILGSPGEQAAIDCAAILAVALPATITMVHVEEIPSLMVGIVPGASVDGDLEADRVAATRWLDTAGRTLAERGVPDVSTTHLVSTAVASALVELAQREHFDLILMSTHGRTGIARVLHGSVAEDVLRHAPCPVLTVHLP